MFVEENIIFDCIFILFLLIMGGTSKSAKTDKNYRKNRPRKRRFAGNQFVDRNRNSKGEASSSAQKIKSNSGFCYAVTSDVYL